jgi:hypothetical protein
MVKKKKETPVKDYFKRAKEKNTVEVPFDKIFAKDISFLNKFHINKKRTYCNIMDDVITSNNDILKYDTNNEFMMNYLAVKYKIDKKAYDDEGFIKELYSTLITKEFISAVDDYVEKNYQFDLDSKQLKKFNEGLQFTDNHSKILLKISVGMKFVIPLVLHYVYYNPSTQEDLGEYLLMAFDPLFDIFSPNVDIINKLYESVYSRVIVTRYSDRTFWYYCEVMGYSIEQLTNNLVKKLIVDIIPKYAFDRNVISLNHVFINNNIEYSFRYNFPINFKPLNLTETENNGLSDFDKLAINTARINESEIIINKVNIKVTIKHIIRKYGIKISEDELRYYIKDFALNRLQKNMMFLFFSKYFGSAISLYNCNVKEYVTLLVLMKKILEKNNFIYLQKILTGRIETVNEKKSLNKKNLLKIIESDKYKVIIENKFPNTIFNIMDSNIITKLIATILNNKFTTYDFEAPKQEGDEIKVNSDIISEEVLRFIEMI